MNNSDVIEETGEEFDWENNDWLYMEEMERRYSFLSDEGEDECED